MPRVRPRHPLPRLPLLGLLAACAIAAVPGAGAARATTLSTDARCYLQGAPLRMTASELTPQAPLTVSLDGQALRYRDGSAPSADAAGTFASSFATPVLDPGTTQRRHALRVEDGTHRAQARFTVTRPAGADFAPARGNPRTLRARFTVWGFALADGVRHRRVWLHWVNPHRRLRATAAIGVTRGDCGTLRTAPRRVFPFAAEAGRWLLVLDTHRRYRSHSRGPRAKISVHVRSLRL